MRTSAGERFTVICPETSHRPWKLPSRPWVLAMRWHDLLFMHWPVPCEALRPAIPPSLAIDTFDGTAWIGIKASEWTAETSGVKNDIEKMVYDFGISFYREKVQRQIDESFDGIDTRYDDVDACAHAESSFALAAHPGAAARFHQVFVVTQVVEMQQSVHTDRGELHEGAELHHGGDEAFEGLPDAVA